MNNNYSHRLKPFSSIIIVVVVIITIMRFPSSSLLATLPANAARYARTELEVLMEW